MPCSVQLGKADAGVKIARTETRQHEKSIGILLLGDTRVHQSSPLCSASVLLGGTSGSGLGSPLAHMLDTCCSTVIGWGPFNFLLHTVLVVPKP